MGEGGAGELDTSKVPRRKGRSARLRSPDDSPLRDGNRDRLAGILTERACKTLLYYCSETNQNLYRWLYDYMKHHPIPLRGSWEDVSGERFLRSLLAEGVDYDVKTTRGMGMDPLFDCSRSLTVDPTQVASRILDIRALLAKEWQEDLGAIQEENLNMLREEILAKHFPSIGGNKRDEREASRRDEREMTYYRVDIPRNE